jgi:hypothetical protein
MSNPFESNNPGLEGLQELTLIEKVFVQSLAGLTYSTGDILYYDGTKLQRLGIGTNGQILKVNTGLPSWETGNGYTNLTEFVNQTPWRVFYSNGDGDVIELAIGASGRVLTSNGTTSAPSWETTGAGDVSKVGTPVDNQLAVWTGDGTIEGDANLTFDTVTDTLSTVGLNLSGLTASELVATDASKNLVSLGVATYPSLTELTYLKGVSSAIQTQINNKMSNPMTTGGDIIYGGGSGAPTRLANGSAGQVLTSNGGTDAPSWTTLGTGGDVSSNTATSVDSEVALFSGTTGKEIKRATGTGVAKLTSGVLSVSAVNLATEVTGLLPFANIADGSANSVLGRAGSGSGVMASITAGNNTILSRSGSGNVAFNNASTIKTILALVKGDVGLGNVDNTSDATKNSATATLTNKRITKRVTSETSSATPTINTDNTDVHRITALAVNITSFTTNLTGTPNHGDLLRIEITGTATRTISWGASFEASTVALPTTTDGTNMLSVGFTWNSATSNWRCIAVA